MLIAIATGRFSHLVLSKINIQNQRNVELMAFKLSEEDFSSALLLIECNLEMAVVSSVRIALEFTCGLETYKIELISKNNQQVAICKVSPASS
jgi:hypothetical protein